MSGSRRVGTVILLALCALIIAIVALEILNPPRLQKAAPISQLSPAVPGGEEISPFGSFTINPLSQYDEIIERPLFLNNRRPPEVLPETAQGQPDESGELRLLGVILTPERMLALLQFDGSDKATRLKIGEKAAGWQLEAISAGSVLLRKGEMVKNLPLVRNKKIAAHPDRMRKVENKQNAQGEVRKAVPAATPAR